MKALTAHDVRTGAVVYLTASGAWSTRASEAAHFTGGDEEAALKRAEAAETVVTHAYLVPLDAAGAPVARERVRETIRARGPTIHPQFAKHAGHES